MKFTETQKELLAMLPEHLQNSKELTDSAKLVLGNIVFLYGMEYAQNNGYVYRTNLKMMEETGIKSEHTLIMAIRTLVILKFIETKRGKRKEASTYKLLKNCSNKLENCSNKLENCSNNCSNKFENCSNKFENCSNKFETLQNQVLLLQKEIVLLQKEIEILKNCSNNCSNNYKKCSTDIDTDIDKENNNNLSILELKDLGPKVTEDKKENKIKEKVNEMRNAVLNEMEREVKNNEIQTSTPDEKNTNFNVKEPVYGNLTDDLFDEIFGMEENEMSDNGTSEMNAKSEMKCNVQHNINEMTTSTQGNIITSNSDNGENKVQSGKVITNCSIFTENCPKPYLTPQIPLTPLSSPNKAAGCVENTSMDNLYTSSEKTQPDAKEVAKTQNNAYTVQEWMTEYEKLLLQVENTDIEDVRFNSILDEGIKLFESFPKNKGNYQRAMQDLRYWAASKLDFNKTFKISEQWGKYYRAA